MYSGGVRVARRKSAKRPAKIFTFAAPTGGLVTNENLAAQRQNTARVLINWFPTEYSIRQRGGSSKVATIGSGSITAMFSYYGSTSATDAFFVADATDIYEVSAFDPDTAPTADVSSLTGGDWSTVQQTTSGGEYLVCVNGADTARTYDGSSWANSGISFSGSYSGVTSAGLSRVWKFKNRLFFVEKDSTRAFFCAADTIANDIGTDSGTGALELGAVFQRGGYLLLGATWSLDAGDGFDDKCVFVSSKGEIAIYEGTDPSDATKWSLVGRYDLSTPLGPEAIMQAGGDLMVATFEGFVPLSAAINTDVAALSLGAVSRNIEPDWRYEVRSSTPTSSPWQVLKWSKENMAIVSLPHRTAARQFVVNLKTGAWCFFDGWNVKKMAVFNDSAYYGDGSGSVWKMDTSGYDEGATTIYHRVRMAWNHLKSLGQHKQAQLARATFIALASFSPKLSVGADYDPDFPSAPAAVNNAVPTTAVWDGGVWDDSQWDTATGVSGELVTTTTRWVSVAANGYVMAPEIQAASAGARAPDAELIQFDLTYEEGAAVV